MNFSDQSEEMLKLLLPHFEKHPFKQKLRKTATNRQHFKDFIQ